MRKLSEIIDGIKDNQNQPEGSEAAYTILVLDQLNQTYIRAVAELYQIVSLVHPVGDLVLSEVVEITKSALSKSPDIFLEGKVPGTEEYDAKRKETLAVMEKMKAQILKIQEDSERIIAEEEAKALKDDDKLN